MKELLKMVCAAIVIVICSQSFAQGQDTASTNYKQENRTEESDQSSQDSNDQTTDQQLEEDADKMKENFEGSTIDKVGPNGEKLFMEKGKYYYIDEEGKKVKVKKSEVKDESQVKDNSGL
jgi:uncharacterized protein YxeA